MQRRFSVSIEERVWITKIRYIDRFVPFLIATYRFVFA